MTDNEEDAFALRDVTVSGSHLLQEDDAVVLRNLARALLSRREPLDPKTCQWLAEVIDNSLEGMSRDEAEQTIARVAEIKPHGTQEACAPRGERWRVALKTNGVATELRSDVGGPVLDEVVIDDWLHLEQMDASTWWLRIGDARITVSPKQQGVAEVYVERGAYGEIVGENGKHERE